MSIETVEIRAFSGPSVVEINGSDQPAIVEINQGPAGAAGPNSVTSATTSDGTANLSLSNVTTATATVTGTLTADHIHGNLAGSVYAHVRAGENLAKGDPVFVSGSHGTGSNLIAIVSKADASDPLKMPAVGVMDAAVTANANGHMVITGTISDINTAAYAVNAELYVAEGGGFTPTPPSAYAQPVARVERSNTNNGAVIVKVNGLSAISPTASTLVRRDSSGVSDFNTINLGNLHTGGSPSAPYGSIGKDVLTGSSGVGISGNPDVALEAATHRLTLSSTGVAIASGTITTSQPLSLTQTWNAAGVTFKGIDVNITDTSSTSGSLLMDLRVGGVSRLSVNKVGSLIVQGGFGFIIGSAQYFRITTASIRIVSAASYEWSSTGDASGSADLFLSRDAANTLAQRNGTNAQESRVYGTYTSATNFERLNLKYNGTATAFQIGTEKGSAGGTARPLEFQTDGTTRMTIGADGQSSLTQTWNAAGTTFKALDVNVTDTASASGSLLMDLRVGGVSKASINKNGYFRLWPSGDIYMFQADTSTFAFSNPGYGGSPRIAVKPYSLQLASDSYIAFSNGGNANGTVDVLILRDAANTLAQRNGANAQVTRIYDTYTSATDYHRLAIATARATATAMSGATVTLTDIIPAGAVVVGVTCKVTTAITGATSFDIGTATDVDRFGAAIAVALGTTSDNRNWTAGTIECFPTATSLILTANGSNFTAGAVYVSVQYLSGQAD